MTKLAQLSKGTELGILKPVDLEKHPIFGNTPFVTVAISIQNIVMSGDQLSTDDVDNLIGSINSDILSQLPENYKSPRGRIMAYDLIQGELFESAIDGSKVSLNTIDYENPSYNSIFDYIKNIDKAILLEDNDESNTKLKEFKSILFERIGNLDSDDNLRLYILSIIYKGDNLFLAKINLLRKKIESEKEIKLQGDIVRSKLPE